MEYGIFNKEYVNALMEKFGVISLLNVVYVEMEKLTRMKIVMSLSMKHAHCNALVLKIKSTIKF